MKISIITACLNSEKTIEDAILSVVNQNFPNIEYIIVDGGSTDGTLRIIEKYKDKISKVISEPDKGLYDAMNKGIQVTTGEIVGILNSDDFYTANNVIGEIVQFFEKGNDAVYGDLIYVEREDKGKIVRKWQAGEFESKKLKYGWAVPHPSFFVRKNLYEKYGLFNLDFKIAADYELMLRFLVKNIKIAYFKNYLVCMREGGLSASNLRQRMNGWKELYMAWKVNQLNPPFYLVLTRTVSKISQYFK